ncbi:diguanylate cyclase domain-containing protein [Candidatus Competibacter phosphatis]|nr:GGDEF domain-containing protein [Candidatus Competibacter phosphatis]
MSFTVKEEEIFLACDFTNRVAVALSNARWEEQLYYMAHYDALSGLPNRLLLKDRLQQALARAERQKNFLWLFYSSIWIVFKYINDSLGHMVGDLLLREVAQRLSRNLRSEDTISRIGGDEFVIVISHFENSKESFSVTTAIAKKNYG